MARYEEYELFEWKVLAPDERIRYLMENGYWLVWGPVGHPGIYRARTEKIANALRKWKQDWEDLCPAKHIAGGLTYRASSAPT